MTIKKLAAGAVALLAATSLGASAQASSILFGCFSSCSSGYLLAGPPPSSPYVYDFDPGYGVTAYSWSVPGNGNGEVPWEGGMSVVSFEINFNLPSGDSIDAASLGVGGCSGTGTVMCSGGSGPWTATLLTPDEILFVAPKGEFLSQGEDYFVNIYFTKEASGAAFDGAFGTAPEPGSWALMIGGIGLAGLALRRGRRQARAA